MIADYAWSAEKLPAGTIALTGYVPTEGLRRVLAIRAGDAAVNEQALGSGAPDGFPMDTLAAVDALKLLDEGTVAFADGKWSLTGRSEDPGAPDAVTAALGERAASWQVAVTAPPPPPPTADPFVWSATKAADGSVAFAGYVSTAELKRLAAARADRRRLRHDRDRLRRPRGFHARRHRGARRPRPTRKRRSHASTEHRGR